MKILNAIHNGSQMPWHKKALLLLLVAAPLMSSCEKNESAVQEQAATSSEISSTPQAEAADVVAAAIGSGWVEYSPTKRIHLDDAAGLQTHCQAG